MKKSPCDVGLNRYSPSRIGVGLLLLVLLCQVVFWQRGAANGFGFSPPAPAPSEIFNGSGKSSMLFPASPIYPILPSGPTPQPMLGVCGLNISVVEDILHRTAGDCTAPLAMYVGNVICCPQFMSMLRILRGEWSLNSGSLALSDKEATDCLADILSYLVESGGNTTSTELCNAQPSNLTHGWCPVSSVTAFEQAVDTRKLLDACSAVDPLRECCNAVCQPAVTDAAVRLASYGSDWDPNVYASSLDRAGNDCEEVVFTWLARELGADVANSAFRILSSCRVNRVCPLTFKDASPVAKACGGSSPIKSVCCSSLYGYISSLQQQMLITNIQALECVTLFGAKLKKEGVTVNVYNICGVDLKDFSLQVHGNQGCLLRSVPSDILYDNISGISFTCDLNDNIPAPWPPSSSLTSFPLCANRESLPALPVLDTSGALRRQVLSFGAVSIMVLHMGAIVVQSIML
ncbi:hypothetical protein GOP47_0003568 [Adiantum capillus-veneris]|uniref:SPARK domain-containing protein n=1 Tax=Adiantum capillus-veneris TaxID=13818 RepID=A0A9D4VD30_ADICA|nr:hypothetical protein GOP47_0003271 [Adiantum capillus-veneris]KAI5083825.1 hypothetical protein GOP47_0003568 [Adiantum capillus-veneris]